MLKRAGNRLMSDRNRLRRDGNIQMRAGNKLKRDRYKLRKA